MAEHATVENQDTGLLDRWKQTEPVRLWLYGVTIPVLALLVGYGVVSDHLSALWLAVATAALLGGGTEVARGFAVSPATARAAVVAATTAASTDHGHPDARAARTVLIRYSIPS